MRRARLNGLAVVPAVAGVAALVAVLGGCSSDPRAAAFEDLDAARNRWKAAGIRDYDLVAERVIFCGALGGVRFRAEVRGGKTRTAGVVDQGCGETAKDSDAPGSLEDVFDLIAAAIPVDEQVDVTYSTIGVPTRAEFDPSTKTYDDQTIWQVRVIVPGAGPSPTPTPEPTGAVRTA